MTRAAFGRIHPRLPQPGLVLPNSDDGHATQETSHPVRGHAAAGSFIRRVHFLRVLAQAHRASSGDATQHALEGPQENRELMLHEW